MSIGTGLFAGLLLQTALQMTPSMTPSSHFIVTAAYEPAAKKDAKGTIVVEFKRLDPDVNVNEEPAPRVKFPAADSPLVTPAPPKGSGIIPDPANAKYLDLQKPVRFEVATAPAAKGGMSSVRTSVSYFYCSKRENWCRKGTAEFDLSVLVQ